MGDDQICAVTRADFIRTPEIRYNDVLIREFSYKENTPESVGRWRPLIEELVKLTRAMESGGRTSLRMRDVICLLRSRSGLIHLCGTWLAEVTFVNGMAP